MPGRKRQETWADLSRAAVRFEQWRGRRTAGARIPATLWKSAVKLAGRHGVSRVATVLKLDYYALKRRHGRQPFPVVEAEAPSAPPAFVELAPSARPSSGRYRCPNHILAARGRLRLALVVSAWQGAWQWHGERIPIGRGFGGS
jgi:hypothetical protein